MGGRGRRKDTLAKITGQATFGVDVVLDSLLIATVKNAHMLWKLKTGIHPKL